MRTVADCVCAAMAMMLAVGATALPLRAGAVEVPVEVATGPSFFNLDRPQLGGNPNRLAADQPWHFGWRLELAAKIDREWAREHPSYIPPQHRSAVQRMGTVRYSPAVLGLIPRSLFISPKIWDTGVYGATWEFMHAGIGMRLGGIHLGVGAGLIFTYAFMHSDNLDGNFHFVRPGLDLGVSMYVPVQDNAGFSIGWDSNIYLPQAIGGGVFDFGADSPEAPLWHIGETFFMFHYVFDARIPM